MCDIGVLGKGDRVRFGDGKKTWTVTGFSQVRGVLYNLERPLKGGGVKLKGVSWGEALARKLYRVG